MGQNKTHKTKTNLYSIKHALQPPALAFPISLRKMGNVFLYPTTYFCEDQVNGSRVITNLIHSINFQNFDYSLK